MALDLEYLEKVIPDYHEKKEIKERLNDLFLRIRIADELHEKFIQQKTAKSR